jgi:hypothetical protein
VPKPTRSKKTVDLTQLVADGYKRLNAVSAKCPECGAEIVASDMEVTRDEGDVFHLICEAVDDKGDACPFYAIVAVKDGQWRLLECGYDYGEEAEAEPCEVAIDDEEDQ